jgi:hypothetical protein
MRLLHASTRDPRTHRGLARHSVVTALSMGALTVAFAVAALQPLPPQEEKATGAGPAVASPAVVAIFHRPDAPVLAPAATQEPARTPARSAPPSTPLTGFSGVQGKYSDEPADQPPTF